MSRESEFFIDGEWTEFIKELGKVSGVYITSSIEEQIANFFLDCTCNNSGYYNMCLDRELPDFFIHVETSVETTGSFDWRVDTVTCEFEILKNKEEVITGSYCIEQRFACEARLEYFAVESNEFTDLKMSTYDTDLSSGILAAGHKLTSLASIYGLVRKGGEDDNDLRKRLLDKLNTKGDNDMAKLSIRDNPQCSTTVSFSTPDSDGKTNLKQLTGEFNMRNIRTVNITLVDSNPHLALEHAVVFSKKDVLTEHNDDKTIQQVMLKEDVNKAIKEHNEKRASTIDKDIQRNTGRGVYLEPVEIWDLEWKITTIA